jgi:hypothetical protein
VIVVKFLSSSSFANSVAIMNKEVSILESSVLIVERFVTIVVPIFLISSKVPPVLNRVHNKEFMSLIIL